MRYFGFIWMLLNILPHSMKALRAVGRKSSLDGPKRRGTSWSPPQHQAQVLTRLLSYVKDGQATPVISDVYKSLLTLEVVGGSSVLLESPTPAAFSFAEIERKYEADIDDICDEELRYGMEKETNNLKGRLNEKRLNRFIGGRVALRRALRAIEQIECNIDYSNQENNLDKCSLVQEVGPILADAHGAPDLPVHVHGSISHKDNLGVGIAIIDSQGRVGCDIERCFNSNASLLSRRVLTEAERGTLRHIHDSTSTSSMKSDIDGNPIISFNVDSTDEDIMLRFSFKEAVFKAIHPYLARSVDFDEVEVFPREGGAAEVKLKLKQEESSLQAEVSWYRYQHMHDGQLTSYFVTYCHSRCHDGSADPNKSKR